MLDVAADPSQRASAVEELRTYLSMLLVSAPVLIDAAPARAFLESAQRLGGLLSSAVAHVDDASVPDQGPRLTVAAQALAAAARPLLARLDRQQLQAVDDAGDPSTGGGGA